MPIFPERSEEHSLVPSTNQELAIIAPGLTDGQKKQLASVTRGYMRDFKLVGYENTRAILPVIKQCTIDGLIQLKARDQIIPADNLQEAFRVGYQKRKALITDIESNLPGTDDNTRFIGILALPRLLTRSAAEELAKKPFTPTFDSGKQMVEIAKIRQPLFRQLVKFSRDQIAQLIPGSNEVSLTPQQETGLVRNLIFGWVITGEPTLLLEVEDFMANTKNYLASVSQADDSLWTTLAKLIGRDNQPTIAYLKDLSIHVADLLSPVILQPPIQTDDLTMANAIDLAFKQLDPYFLVVNPFNKLEVLSEDPQDKEKSIWNPEKSVKVTFDGQSYLFPSPYTLYLASYLISGQNRERSIQLKQASQYARDLLDEINAQGTDKTILKLQGKIEKEKADLEIMRQTIARRITFAEAAIPKTQIQKSIQKQRSNLAAEEAFFSWVRYNRNKLIDEGLSLLPEFLDPEKKPTPRNIQRLQGLYFKPGIIRNQTMRYLRGLGSNLNDFFSIQSSSTFINEMAREANLDSRQAKFQMALDTTMVDLLEMRNKFWLDCLLTPKPPFTRPDLEVIWSGIVQAEQRRINKEIAGYMSLRSIQSDIEQYRADISQYRYHPLHEALTKVEELQSLVSTGEFPEDSPVYNRYLEAWKKSLGNKLAQAINWDKPPLTKSTATVLSPEEQDNLDVTVFRKITVRPLGSASIILRALAKLAPVKEPSYEVTLQNIMQNTYQRETDDPFLFVNSVVLEQRQRSVIYGLYKDWLDESGIRIITEALRALVRSQDIDDLITSANVYHRLFKIEEETKRWYGHLRIKLANQEKNNIRMFYGIPPADLIREKEAQITADQEKAERLQRVANDRLKTKADKLKQLRLLLPEKES